MYSFEVDESSHDQNDQITILNAGACSNTQHEISSTFSFNHSITDLVSDYLTVGLVDDIVLSSDSLGVTVLTNQIINENFNTVSLENDIIDNNDVLT